MTSIKPRLNTAEHILFRILIDEYGAKQKGLQLKGDSIRIGVECDKNLKAIPEKELEGKVNMVIRKNIEVKKYELDREKAGKIVDVSLVPKSVKKLRIVEIGDFDKQACATSHVDNTKEIGVFKILKVEKKGKKNYNITSTVTGGVKEVVEKMTGFQTPRGTRDFLPKDMVKRDFIFDTVKKVFEAYGFEPLETPAFEEWSLLSKKGSGGDEIKQEIYYFKDKGNRELGLRFDLTVPMCRVIALNPQLPKPFKRYQIGRVWRYDRPQAGRYREFWQADVDVAGVKSVEADMETIVVMVEVLKKLGFKEFSVRLNNRKILNGMVEFMDIPKKKVPEVFRILDKLEKAGGSEVKKELKKEINPKKAEKLLELIKRRGKPEEILAKEMKALGSNDTARMGLEELQGMVEKAKIYGIADRIEIDFSLVRGLDYYTGPIFEISVETEKNVGSVAGGGRYDNLIELYGGKWTPATGISLGVERIFEIMEAEKMFKLPGTKTLVFVVAVDERLRRDALRIAQKLRKVGIPVQTDLMGRNMKKQLEYVNSAKIPFALFVGEREKKSGKFTLRNMINGEQKVMGIETMIKAFSKLIPSS